MHQQLRIPTTLSSYSSSARSGRFKAAMLNTTFTDLSNDTGYLDCPIVDINQTF